MHRRQAAAAVIGALSATLAFAAIPPRQDYSTDCSQPPVKRQLTFVQGSSQVLGWTFTQGSTAKDLTGATDVRFVFSPTSRAWTQTITGAVDVATNGTVLFSATPAQLATNTATVGACDWLITVGNTTDTLAYAYGKLTLIADPTGTNQFVPASPWASQAWVLGLGYGADTLDTVVARGSNTASTVYLGGASIGAWIDDLWIPAALSASGISAASATHGSLDLASHASVRPSSGGDVKIYHNASATTPAVHVHNGTFATTINSNLTVTGDVTINGNLSTPNVSNYTGEILIHGIDEVVHIYVTNGLVKAWESVGP